MRKIDVIEENGRLYFQRLTVNQRIQHVILFVSFTLLAATGLPLKFHHTWWGETLYELVGGITYAPIIHRISAVVMTLLFLYHIVYVLYCAWRYYLLPLKMRNEMTFTNAIRALFEMPMVPNFTDLHELKETLKYFLFLTDKRPKLVAHGLKEKFGYLAVFWGIPVIGLSGFFLWGESYFTRYFSGNVLNFAYIAHSDEAFLASIVIFIWHLYNVHGAPAVFPMGPAWIKGYVGEREMVEYHYSDYVRAMTEAGLQDRIREITAFDDSNRGLLFKILQKSMLVALIAALSLASAVIVKIIYESVFVLGYQIVTTEPVIRDEPIIEPKIFEEIILDAGDNKTFYRGYRFVREKQITDHYHRIELEVGPETVSPCITCHGDLPHGSSKHVRAFLNMHNLYFSCKTCHVRSKSGSELHFYWYNRETGDHVPAPVIEDQPIDSINIKLAPCESCTSTVTDNDILSERRKYREYLNALQRPETTPGKKKDIIRKIHERISEKPVSCAECHNRKDTYLPLRELGYPEYRVKAVATDQITKLIEEYQEFYTPAFLEPVR